MMSGLMTGLLLLSMCNMVMPVTALGAVDFKPGVCGNGVT